MGIKLQKRWLMYVKSHIVATLFGCNDMGFILGNSLYYSRWNILRPSGVSSSVS